MISDWRRQTTDDRPRPASPSAPARAGGSSSRSVPEALDARRHRACGRRERRSRRGSTSRGRPSGYALRLRFDGEVRRRLHALPRATPAAGRVDCARGRPAHRHRRGAAQPVRRRGRARSRRLGARRARAGAARRSSFAAPTARASARSAASRSTTPPRAPTTTRRSPTRAGRSCASCRANNQLHMPLAAELRPNDA